MCTLDSYIVTIALPVIAEALHADLHSVSWVIIAYLLTTTATILLCGRLGDQVGLIRLFKRGYLLFVLASLLCGLSGSLGFLIAARCLQGLGGSIIYALPSAIVSRHLPAQSRGMAFGILTTAAALGFTVGSPLGGFITVHCGWHWVFLVNVPVGALAMILASKFLPRDQLAPGKLRLDGPGITLSALGLASLLYGLTTANARAPWLVASVVLLSAFLLWERSCRDPLVDLAIFRCRDFTLANLNNFLVFIPAMGCNFMLPFYLVTAQGLKTEEAGLVMISFAIVNMAAGPIAGKASDRISPKKLCRWALVLTMGASLGFAATLARPSLVPVVTFLLISGGSLGFFLSPNNNQLMRAAPQGHQGQASGILRTITNLGSVMGVAIFQALLSAAHSSAAGTEGFAGYQLAMGVATCAYALAFVCNQSIKGGPPSPREGGGGPAGVLALGPPEGGATGGDGVTRTTMGECYEPGRITQGSPGVERD